MKLLLLIPFLLLLLTSQAQTALPPQEAILERAAENPDRPPDDELAMNDDFIQRHKLNLNSASVEALMQLHQLSAQDVARLIRYRQLFGKFIDLYELQAVPGFDIALIRSVLPYITITDTRNLSEKLGERLHGGDKMLMVRYGSALGGENTDPSHYTGSSVALRFRFTYNYRNLLQWGFSGDKDPGEAFFRGPQKQGFDFYSFHLFAKALGPVRAVAIGDFRVNMGQGLIQWQGLSFGMSGEVMQVQHEGPVLSPYRSAAEYNFYRGGGMTIAKDRWQFTAFGSSRRLSGNRVIDTVSGETRISSIQLSGYHRTSAELDDKNSFVERAAGVVMRYGFPAGHVALNAIGYHFSLPLQKQDRAYNVFAVKGSQWMNASVDYDYTVQNFHFFGETGIDRRQHGAILAGCQVSLNKLVDLAVVARTISPQYQAFHADSFTEGSAVSNETGVYAGLLIRPLKQLKLAAYIDVFRFPFIRFQVNNASTGIRWLLQAAYTPSKSTEILLRIRQQRGETNDDGSQQILPLVVQSQTNVRLNIRCDISKLIQIRHRLEYVIVHMPMRAADQGFLTYVDASVKFKKFPVKINTRLQFVQTGSYESRIYVYEESLPYSFSIDPQYGNSCSYAISLQRTTAVFKKRNVKILSGISWRQVFLKANDVLYYGSAITSKLLKNKLNAQVLIFF